MRAVVVLSLATLTSAPWQPASVDPVASAFRRKAELDVVLLVDVSYSVSHPGFFKTDKELMLDAAAGLAEGLGPSDRARLGTFGTTITIVPEVLQGPAAIARAAAALTDTVGGPSPIWDAIVAAAAALDRPASGTTSGRRAVIVVTDGRSSGNQIRFDELLHRLDGPQVAVFVVALDVKRPPLPDPAVRLRRLAVSTGGTYILVKRERVDGAVRKAVEALRSRPD